jgi:hypothetical protein
MLALLKLVPLKDWIYLSLIVALLGGFVSYTIHERDIGKAHELAVLKKSSDELQAKAAAHVAQVAKAYSTASISNLETLNAQLKTASDQHDSDAQRLREYDAYRRAHPAVASAQTGSGTGGQGGSGANQDDGQLSSLEQVALGLATAGREVNAALGACMADRNALTGKP